MVEVRGLPGLKIQTWGTHFFYLSDVGHPPKNNHGLLGGIELLKNEIRTDQRPPRLPARMRRISSMRWARSFSRPSCVGW